jgi:hypothetical protein
MSEKAKQLEEGEPIGNKIHRNVSKIFRKKK